MKKIAIKKKVKKFVLQTKLKALELGLSHDQESTEDDDRLRNKQSSFESIASSLPSRETSISSIRSSKSATGLSEKELD